MRKIFLVLFSVTYAYIFFTPLAPVAFFSSQARDDITRQLIQDIGAAKNTLEIYAFELYDQRIQRALAKKNLAHIVTNKNNTHKGLMHHKVFICDDVVYFGSANLTEKSLRLHKNLSIRIQDAALAHSLVLLLQKRGGKTFQTIHGQDFEIYITPYRGVKEWLIGCLGCATKSLDLALYSFTEPSLWQALYSAASRGVSLRLVLDQSALQQRTLPFIEDLIDAGGKVFMYTGLGLMHHKFCRLDSKTLIFGSANWTKAAFSHNDELICKLFPLSSSQEKKLTTLFEDLLLQSRSFPAGKPTHHHDKPQQQKALSQHTDLDELKTSQGPLELESIL